MLNALTDLFLASGGEVGRFCPIPERDLATYEALLHYRYVMLESYEDGETIHWEAALSEEGRRFYMESNDLNEDDAARLPIPGSITLTFDLRDAEEADTFAQLRQITAGHDLLPALTYLLRLHAILEAGDAAVLLEHYPQLADDLRMTIEAELAERDQQQMTQLLAEIEGVKAMLRQQLGRSSAASASGFNGLQPVVPLQPVGSPKQLDVPQFDMPEYDEEEVSDLFVVQADKEAGKEAAENFLKSLQGLQGHQ